MIIWERADDAIDLILKGYNLVIVLHTDQEINDTLRYMATKFSSLGQKIVIGFNPVTILVKQTKSVFIKLENNVPDLPREFKIIQVSEN